MNAGGLMTSLRGKRQLRRATAAAERRALRQDPKPRQQHVVPLEPRIMMDAVLDFGADATFDNMTDTAAVSALLTTAINLVEEMGAFGDLLKHELADAMGDSLGLFSSSEANPYIDNSSATGEGARATDDTFDGLTDFGTELGEQLLAGIRTQIEGALGAVKTQMATEINAYVDAQLTAYQTTLQGNSQYVGRYEITAAELTAIHNSVSSAVGGLTYADILDPKAAFAEILTNAGDYAQSLALGPKAVPLAGVAATDPPPGLLTTSEIATETGVLKGSLISRLATAIDALPGSLGAASFDTSIALGNIVVGGETLVEFTQGADNRHVDVSVALAGLIPDLDGIFETLGIDGDSFEGYADFKTAYEAIFDDLTLDLELALVVTNGPVLVADPDGGGPGQAIYHKNFALTASNFDTNLGFGGSIDAEDYLEDMSISAGMLSASITSIDLATFGVDFGDTAIALSFSTNSASFAAAVKDADNHSVTYGAGEAQRLSGDHSLTDFNFIDVTVTEAGGNDADNTKFKYAALGFEATIDWGVVDELEELAPAYTVTGVRVDGSLALVSGAGGFAVTAGPLTAKALNGTTEIVELTTTPEQEAQWDALQDALADLTSTVTALMDFDGAAYVDVLSNLAAGLDALFESPIFDVELPFLDDFHLSDVLNAYQAITDALLEPLHAGLEVIGLSEGNDTSAAGVVLVTGLVVDPDDGTILDDLGGDSFSLTIDVNSQTASTTDASTATVPDTFTATIAVPVGGFANLEALAAAISSAFAALSGTLGTFQSGSDLAGKVLTAAMSVTATRGAIEFRAGPGVNSFKISGDVDVMSAFGSTPKNNVASFHAGGSEDLQTLSLSDLVDNDWMNLFTLNLELTRTVLFSDGSTEVIDYKTLTLSPEGGAWTVADLKAQLNELFDATGIHMTVADGATAGTLKFHVVDDALTTVGTETGKTVTDVSYGFAIDGANASFASSVEVMQAFVADLIDDVIPGAEFVIDIAQGAIKLVLPELEFAYATAFTEALDFDVGALGSLELAAQFQLFAQMSLGLTVGVDIVGFAGNTDDDLGFADFVFIEDARLDAALGATAQAITGTGLLGVIEVEIGDAGAPPADNSVAVGAALHVTLVGENEGEYSNRLSFNQIWQEANSATGIAGMIGAFDLSGTVGPTGNTSNFAFINLKDIKVGISGVNIGIEDDVISSFSASLADWRNPTDWDTDVQSAVADLFTGFGKDDVIDSLYNSLVLINQVLSGLVENMSFLGEEIPVLGVSFIDAMSFTEELAAKLQEFKNNPNGTLDEIGDALRSALGITDPNGLILHFDDNENVFWVSLGLSFLDGAELSYDFALDLMDLLGSLSGSNPTVANLLDLVSSVANVTGEGTIILDAGVDLALTFGIDLGNVLGAPPAVTAATALGALASVSQVTFNTLQSNNKGNDVLLSVKRFDGTTNKDFALKVDLDGVETVGDALSALLGALEDAGLDDEIGIVVYDVLGNAITIDGDSLGALYDNDGVGSDVATAIVRIEFIDIAAQAADFDIDYAAVEALFGDASDLVPDVDGKITGTADLTDADFNPAAEHSFALVINGSEPIVVTVGAWVAPTAGATPRDLAGFVAELQAKLASQLVERADIGLGAFGTIPLDKLITAALVADGAERHLQLTLSNFAPIINGTGVGDDFVEGDQIELKVTGLSKGATSTVSLEDLGGSNLATALGFAGDDVGPAAGDDGSLGGAVLVAKAPSGGISAFFATEDVIIDVDGDDVEDDPDDLVLQGSGVSFSFTAGVTDGLNMTLAMGPLSVSVVDGQALISGANSANPATVHFGFNDAAGAAPNSNEDEDGRFYLDAIADAFGPGGSISDLFTLTADVYLNVVLPLEDSLGLLDPSEHRILLTGELITMDGGAAVGILPALLPSSTLEMSDYLTFDLDLPDFASILADLNPFAILNDPLLLTSGLDMILTAIDKTLRKVINAMDLPIVGDSMMQGLDLFNDIKNSILQPILAAASTPDPITGELPTTIKLLETVVNDALKDLFGIDEDIISAYLFEDPDNAGANPVLYAEIAFSATVFEAALDVAFDLGIPGFDLNVGEASELMFEIVAQLHVGFGLDRNGFFFLNDTDNPEISLLAVVSTSEGFTAAATLGVVGLSLTANEIEDEDYFGAMISGEIAIDLFTTLGSALEHFDDEDTVEDAFIDKYENVVRLDQLSSSASGAGQGTKAVSISGTFEVHMNFAVTTGITNPITGDAINDLPKAFADFVLDASYTIGGELEFDTMEFQNLGLYAGDFLTENLLPVLEQIATYISPIADAVSFLKETSIGPMSLYDLIEQAVMSAGGPAAQSALFIFKAATTIAEIVDFIESLSANDGIMYFGTFSLLSASSATGVVDVSDTKQVSALKPTGTASSTFSLNAAMQNRGPGITFDLKLFDDVSNVLNLITGNLAEVDLFEIHLTLLDFTLNIDLKATIGAAISFIPDVVLDALLGGMNATFYVHAEAGMTVGYDLYGISNFLTSGDASDIADGIYFDSDRPLLALEAAFNARIGVNFWIIRAGLELGGYFGVSIDLNDPNDDGKMRFSELEYIFGDGAAEGLLRILEGDVKGGIYMSVYYELDFFFFDISDSFELFSYDFSAHFGYEFPPQYLTIVGTTATFNVGAKAGDQIGGDTEDGDDSIVFNGDGTVTINGVSTSLGGATQFVIYAGDGDNFIDFSLLGDGFSVQYVSGSGNDTVIAGQIAGVISTGDGDDTISYAAPSLMAMSLMAFGVPYGPGALSPYGSGSAGSTTPPAPTADSAYKTIRDAAAASGAGGVATSGPKAGTTATGGQTLLIHTGDGHDTVDMADSTQGIVVVSGGDMEITNGSDRVRLSDWLLDTYQGKAPDMTAVLEKIEPELARYTALWQTEGDDTGDIINTGSGKDLIFAGNGDDQINSGAGDDQVYAGAGDDTIDTGDDHDWVEGGAGADVIIGGEGNDVLFGWSRFDETTTAAEFASVFDLSHVADGDDDGTDTTAEQAKALEDFVKLATGMMVDDGSDWIEGNDGDDILHGNGSSDILQGNAGDDLIFGGADTDIMAGGSVTVTQADGTVLSQTVDLSGVYTVSTDVPTTSDGNDHLLGQGGSDVMVGGAGDDTLEGGDFFNVLIGDFADLKLSGTSLLEVRATAIESTLQGDDILIGGSVNDVMMGNGGMDTLSGGMGNNVLIGDNADLEGNNLFKGVETMVSRYSSLDDADTIYTGLTRSLIVAGAGGTLGDTIQTGLSYGTGSTKAERMIIFADYGDLSGPQSAIGTLTTTFSAGDADTITTTGGDDIIFGGVGADTIASGDGNDIVFGDTGTYRAIQVSGGDPRGGFLVSSEHNALHNNGNDDATESDQTIVGNDVISGGDGNNIVIAGGGADTIATGSGMDVIVGDLGNVRVGGRTEQPQLDNNGKVVKDNNGDVVMVPIVGLPDLEASSGEPGVLGLDDLPAGGAWGDTISAGLGDDVVIGGDGADAIGGGAFDSLDPSLDRGKLVAMGDFGAIGVSMHDADGTRVTHDLSSGEPDSFVDGDPTGPMTSFKLLALESFHPGKGGPDELYGGADEDVLVGGDGGDLLHGYGGDDLLFGDHVTMADVPATGGFSAGGKYFDFGGADEIYGGDGSDVAVGGFDGDQLDMGAGNDIGVGDWAWVDLGLGTLVTANPLPGSDPALAATAHGGVDTILGGDGEDVLVGGREGDQLFGNGGANVIFGDYADFSWFDDPGVSERFRLATITLAADQITGDDTIYVNNDTDPDHASGNEADGSSIAIGQRGEDVINGGTEDDFLAGDWVTFLLRDPALYSGSAFDRIITIESINNWIKDDDEIYGNSGRDVIIAGDGDDYVEGGEDQDLIAGDEAVYTRYYDGEGHELLESRFPFEGGDDVLKGGPGNDMVISGFFNFGTPGAGDLIYGDTIEDFLMAGAGSLYIHGAQVERFNYLGIAPADNISNRQLSASAGVQLRPDYERDQFEEDERPSPFEFSAREIANMLQFEQGASIEMPSSAEFYNLDALLSARILSDEILRLIELYRQGAVTLEDLDAELREALVSALFDAYGYRLPEPVANMLERYLELLYERLDIGAAPVDASASADPAEFARRFAAAFDTV